LPDAQIDFLTSTELHGFAKAPGIFNNVYSILHPRGGGLIAKLKLKRDILKSARALKKNSYDTVIDLQNNRNSKIILSILKPAKLSEFDKYSPKAHSTRVLETIQKAEFENAGQEFIGLNSELKQRAEEILAANGWDKTKKLVVLNPAGLWITRNWPLENYAALAKLYAGDVMFLIMGDERINTKAKILKASLGEKLIDLSGKTTLAEAFAVLSKCSLVISEDSGLAHMAWALGVPLVLMLGATRSDWTCHTSGRIVCLNSSDLECGNCMSEICKYGDVHCLTRYTPELIYEKSQSLLKLPY
jgi:ADP-heptose:LPS heptosyltransferase